MTDEGWLSQEFDAQRPRLRAVAYRMLGSPHEADDAVQEAWLRLERSDAEAVDNLGGWLTTVVSRICLDLLRARRARREELASEALPELVAQATEGSDPEREALLADALGPALLVVLDTLRPAERVSFVLHDMFGVPFDEIAPILGRSPDAAKQLASRGRRRLRGTTPPPNADARRGRRVVDAFLAASRDGDFERLVAVLDPDVLLRADATAVEMGAPPEVRGAAAVARVFSGRALAARPALIDGAVGVVWAPGGTARVAWELTIVSHTITRIEMLADPAGLAFSELVVLEG